MSKQKKGGKLKWIIIVIIILAVIGAVAGGNNNNGSDTAPVSSNKDLPEINTEDTDEKESEPVNQDDSATTEETTAEDTPDAEPSLTMGQKNALSKAGDYLAISGFSHDGLISQLEFEGFSTEEATYAADNCGADWNEQAAKKAQEYLDVSSFSRSGLIDQLKFEGFTDEQAEYGVTAVGY